MTQIMDYSFAMNEVREARMAIGMLVMMVAVFAYPYLPRRKR